MKAEPLVSIVTPSYNSENYIESAILTIKHQTYPHIEHIIIDGGSTDSTLDIVRRHEGTYNMRWVSEPDNGMYDAINKGFRVARGEILAEMDTDDMYLPWSVAIAVQALKKHPLIFGDWLSVDPEGRKANMQVVVPFISSFYRATGIIAQPTVFWRRDVTDKIGGFDQHFKLLGDVEYWLRADVAGFTFHKINEVLAIVRNCSNSQSLSPHNRALLRRELEEIRDKYSNAVARVLWRLVHPVPFVRRAYLIRYWLGFSNTWPMFRCSKALPTRMRTLLSLMWLGSSRINLLIDWSKLLPTGVVL